MKAESPLVTINCGECGGVYAIGERYRDQKRDKGGYWNCPYCRCSWGYGESLIEKERKKNEQLRTLYNNASASAVKALQQADKSERRRKAQKAATTRIKNRVKAGVCPCCTRTFQQLARHMKTKHPEYTNHES